MPAKKKTVKKTTKSLVEVPVSTEEVREKIYIMDRNIKHNGTFYKKGEEFKGAHFLKQMFLKNNYIK